MRKAFLLNPYYLILTTCCLLLTTPALSLTLLRVEPNKYLKCDYLDIFTDSDVKATGVMLDDQLIITIPDAKLGHNFTAPARKFNHIKSYSVTQLSGEAVVTINLKNRVDYSLAAIFGKGKTSIEISENRDYSAELFAAWEKQNLKTKGEIIKPEYFAPAAGQALRGKVIVIEPGHGGKDPGALSRSKLFEKHLTLQTARTIARSLSAAGATVYLTRNSDRTCNLKDVVDFANGKRADIFLSLHYNYNGDPRASGLETYYYTGQSRSLARVMHRQLAAGMGRKDRGLKREMFYTVHHTDMPAVLIEPAYLSNAEDEELAVSGHFQAQLARTITEGVKNYFQSR